MRYEDASHTAFQGNEPVARDDSDALPANTRGPATGNIITGEGTQTGSAGADQAMGAHITSIAGKGGEDSSFAAGQLSVAGEFGRLSVDADGNYNYMANAGTPENSRDRFSYTLADSQGNSDSALLIIEIGKTPAVIKANAQQIVPGPDGVVTLPPGVSLADVHIVGRNLVIDLPDGTQLVIVDGAVFVPQLVLDGVEVPATNLAALLIGQEPQPAAGDGPPQSSGGNFDVPVPPLDPGVPLGDLIPPTEYGYTPPDVEEIGQVLDRDPEAGIASAQLDDDAQAGGIAGGVGDDPGSDFAEGFLPGSGGDGSLEWAQLASGAPTGFSYVANPDGSVDVFQDGNLDPVLHITVDAATGEYTVTQLQPIAHPDGGDENNVEFVIDYSVTDEDGDVAIGSLTINVDDDTPTVDATVESDANVVLLTQDAETDGDPTETDTDSTSADFGGIFGATGAFGADGPGTSSVSYALSTTGGASGLTHHGEAINLYLIGGVVVGSTAASAGAVDAGNTVFDISVDGSGVVTVNQYSQIDHTNTDPSPTGPGYEDHLISMADGAVTLTLTASVTDGDEDTVTDTASVGIGANIQFADDGPSIDPTLNEVGGAVVDESEPVEAATIALADGYTAGDDPHLSGGLAIGKGSTSGPVIDANAVFGADGPANGGGISYALEVLNATSGLTTTDGTAINLVELSNGVVVGVVDGTATVAFAVSIDSDTGVVTVEQYLSLFHPDSPDNFDEPVFLDEGSLGVTVTASDFDGDSVTSDAVDITSLIRFEDDGPSIEAELNADATVTVDESLPSGTPGIDTGDIDKGDDPDLEGGLAIGQANSGVAIVDANAVFGADGPAETDSLVYALSITNTDPGVTLTDGTPIELQMVNGVIVGVVDGGAFDGQAAFAIAIDPETGVVTVEQYLSLDHPVNPDPNDPLSLGENSVAVNVTATDGDGDQITSDDIDISGQITFLDDGPAIDPALNEEATVVVDETLPSTDPVIDTGSYAQGDDPDLDGDLALGYGSSGSAVVDASAVFGADGPQGEGATYALTILGVSSGVTLTDGTPINLVLEGGVIVGVVDGGDFDGQAAFAIAIDVNTGVITVEQYLSLDHPVNPDPNDPLGLGDSTVGVTVTATDGDGDPVTSDAVDVSSLITFLDDGPSADAVLQENATAVLDESLPSTDPVIDTPGVTKGNDPDLAGGQAIGFDTTGSAVIDPNAFFGADGPAAGGGISYSLSVLGAASGLTVTDGSPIELQMLANGVIVGVVDGGDFDGQAAFAIAIDPDTGVVSVEQYLSLNHPDDTDPNDPLSMDELTVGVTATITDGDGDSITTDAIDISGQITFLDDGPEADPVVNADATVTVDESLPSTAPAIDTGVIVKGDDPDLPGGLALGQANSGAAVIDPNVVYGADGPAESDSLLYALSIISVDPGVTLTDGTTITMQLVDGVIVGVVDSGDFEGQAAFAIAIDPVTGVVSVEQYLSLDHPVNPDPNDPLGLGDNTVGVTVTATDGDGDSVTFDAVDISGLITFLDDGPAANNDTDTTDPVTDQATGNVITGFSTNEGTGNADVPGADGFGAITNLVGFNGSTDNNPVGGFDVTGEFGTLEMDANGNYTYTRTGGAGGDTDTFTYTYVDGDGDPVTATLVITIADETPNLPNPDLIHLDDDVIPGKGGNVPDGPNDDDPDVVGENVVNGQLNGTGGNAPLTYNFTGVDTLPAGFSIGAGSDADTLLIVQDQNGSDVTVMTIQLDQSDGSFTVTQNNPIWHPTQNGTGNDDTENNLDFSIGVEVEDADGDVEPAAITINVDDDTPTINVTKGDDSAVTLTTDDAQTIGVDSDTAVTTANFSGVFGLTQSAGADGTNAAATLLYTLDVTGYTGGPAGVNSGLESHDADIFLYEIGGKVVGSTSATLAGVNAGNTVFDVGVAVDGVVTLTQYSQIDHDTVDPSPTGSPFADHIVSLADGLVTLTASASLTDKDGDTVTDSETANIGANLRFTDDGPNAEVDGQVQVPTLTLDESPEADPPVDEGGDFNPAGLASVTVGFADNFMAEDYGADGPGTVSYALVLETDGSASGMFALDNTDTSILDTDGYGQGDEILLYDNNGVIEGRVGTDIYFTISVNASGEVTFTQLMNVWHSDPTNDDDTSWLSAAPEVLQLEQTVTDFDGDTDTALIDLSDGVFAIEDDGPEIIEFTDATGPNTGPTPSAEGIFDFDIGTDSPNGDNDDIFVDPDSIVIRIDGVALDPVDNNIVFTADVDANGDPAPEDANFAYYRFTFEYANGPDSTTQATGTLVFDKTAGTYTVTLISGPIEGFTTLETETGGNTFIGYELNDSPSDPDVPDATQPTVAVTKILDESAPGEGDGFYVQFTGFGAGNGEHETIDYDPVDPAPADGDLTTWTEGELFSEGTGTDALWNSWVSVSGSANGVGGDQTNGPDALNFDLYSSDPGGTVGGLPSASATDMFLHFDTIGDSHDMVVVLKLWQDTDGIEGVSAGDTFTTKALVIQGSDIYQFDADSEAGTVAALTGTKWEGVVTEIVGENGNNNDGLVIIESNDYDPDGDGWQIIGAQIVNTALGVEGDGINYNNAVGDTGESTGTQDLSVVTDTGPLKIMNIGFLVSTTADQSFEIDFDVTITDADGDSETTSLTATIGETDSPMPVPFAVESSQEEQLQKSAANSNTLTMAAAVAAAGMAESAAAAPSDDQSFRLQSDSESGQGTQEVSRMAVDDGAGDSSSVAALPETQEADAAAGNSGGHSQAAEHRSDASLDAAANQQAANDQSADQAANDQGPASAADAQVAVAPAVMMVSAEALQAAGLDGNGHQGDHGAKVEQVLAEALGHGAAPTVDGLLASIGNGEVGALHALASPAFDNAPAWDMGMQGGFANAADMLMKVSADMAHHDAVQPGVNG